MLHAQTKAWRVYVFFYMFLGFQHLQLITLSSLIIRGDNAVERYIDGKISHRLKYFLCGALFLLQFPPLSEVSSRHILKVYSHLTHWSTLYRPEFVSSVGPDV